jgi:hypothetical protein
VATYAIRLAHRTTLDGEVHLRQLCCVVAGKALRVVKGRVVIDGLMRVVARQTTDPLVVHEASTVLKAVRLESNIGLTVPVVAHGGIPGAMTLAAEIRSFGGAHLAERFGNRGEFSAWGVRQVLLRPLMAALTSQTGPEFFQSQTRTGGCAAGVTVEALQGFPDRELAAHRFRQVVRGNFLIPRGGCERLVTLVIAHQAFVEIPILLKNPGLGMLAKDPANGQDTMYVLWPFFVCTEYE